MDTATLGVILLEIFTIFVLFSCGTGIIGLASAFRLVLFAAVLLSIFGLLFERLHQRDFRRLIESADLHYDLKDRLLTASSNLSRPDSTPMERLQLRDAAACARQVDLNEVLPARPPRHFRLACGLSLLLPFAVYFAFSNSLQHFIEPTAKLDKRLDEQSAQPLERLSPSQQKNFSEATAASLAEIGAALSASKATQAAGSALQTGDFSLASKELRSVPWNQVTPPEREIMGKMLQQAAGKIKRRNLSQLSQVAERLADDLSQGTLEDLQLAASELAEIAQTADSRREIQRSLEEKLAHWEEWKADFTDASNGGRATSPSEMPSQAQGKGDAGDPRTGRATQLDAIRQLQQLQGRQGTGPSEMETIFSHDATQETAGRPSIDVDRRPQQTAETAMEVEPIPLRQRPVIRKYFEQMRNDQ